MNPKHTPGPWEARLDDRWPEWNVHAPAKESHGLLYIIAENVNGDSSGPMYGTPEDNARLIAAAPELLAACEKAVTWLEGWASAEPIVTELRDAIAKATGSRA